MPRKSHGGSYPDDWKEISRACKEAAGWKCIRCGHANDQASGHLLTVHHLDMNPSNCAWWNLLALCQKCHLRIQAKVIIERPWLLDHSDWFKPYVAGFYAHVLGFATDREYVTANMETLIAKGQGRLL
jgi:hypothetical protein